jgi:hypothetical protein
MSLTKNKSKTAKERRQEREKEILSKQVSRAQAIRDVELHIEANPGAATALDGLVEQGCNRERILWSLYQFCGGNPADAEAVKRVFASRRESLLRFSKRLTGIASDLEAAKLYLSDMELDIVFPQSLIEQISSLAASLEVIANTAMKRYSSRRTSGRDHHLVYLATIIKGATRREHYKELAELIDAIRFGYDPKYEEKETANTIRNLVDRNRPLDLAFSPKIKAMEGQRSQPTAKHPALRKK